MSPTSSNLVNIGIELIKEINFIILQRESLMNLLMNTEEDSELRINAYLGVMRCPSEVIVTQVCNYYK